MLITIGKRYFGNGTVEKPGSHHLHQVIKVKSPGMGEAILGVF